MRRVLGATSTIAAIMIAACTDQPMELDRQPVNAPAAVVASGRTVMEATDRFSIDIAALGSFRPNEPVQITASVSANVPTGQAEVTVTLPEVELARASGWGRSFHYDVGTAVPSARRQVLAMGRGARVTESVSVTVPAEGLYRVVVRASAGETADLHMDGRWIQNTAVVERWLLITNDGGRFLRTLDEIPLPKRMLSLPGPVRAGGIGSNVPSYDPSPFEESLPKHGPNATQESITSFITYRILYWDSDAGSYQPVKDAYVAIRACTKDPWQFICDPEDFQHAEAGYTDSDGYYQFSCHGDEYEGDASTYTAGGMRVNDGVVAIPHAATSSDCGQSFNAVLPSDRAKVFLNSMSARAGASSLFGANRSWIEINVSGSTGSFYDPSADEITINTSHVWGAFGVFVAAHEYGHAYHEDALYGNVAGGTCPSPHYLDTESNLQCAYSEGFADYFGAAVRSDLGTYYYRDYMEDNDAFPGCVARINGVCSYGPSTEGALIEGAFAAMLYDLTDTAVEAHDSIAAPGAYIRELIRTCQVNYLVWRRANGTDEITYCAENAINPGSYFTPRGTTPSTYSESASEGGGWTSGRVNLNWTFNMYEKQ